MQTDTGLRLESFAPGYDGADPPAADAATANWLEAVRLGFHEPRADPERLPAMVDAYRRDGRVLTGVYDDESPDGAWDAAIPVATYATMVNTLNVGGGQLLPAHLVTCVTVRATHRRRGILRRMITADLAAAQESGLAVAALTASEATIYGRFGFGAATSTAAVAVDTRNGLGFRAPAAGMAVIADSARLLELAPEIFRAHHSRTAGALGRQHAYALRASGAWSEHTSEPDKELRAVLHYDAAGNPDGYATYKFTGWDTEPQTLKITDLIAATGEAYRELWRFLGSIDLVDRLTYDAAPLADPLPWMLADRRRYGVTGVEDVLWLRILDTRAALEARHYTGSGAVVLTVADPLGLAAGTWHLAAEGGRGTATELPGGTSPAGLPGVPAAEIDADALGSLYLGGVSAATLAAAGGIRGGAAALDAIDALFTAGKAPYCNTHF
ncbi:GNAT family N-acetyltransferase [Arthrobacter sp. ATA002]|uniref:GNAT family N-acetyltransferase n=1 Tax=Arthrobacter sp. ATA002 TaxID=2991715 RepID=UPI0022A77D97|nr:GNAT family N-acetyltransferase [Arthrobacter sp. ATA002]WAP53222.1 GNAT family N-acetyltransferase [Arthrobacter sp. ATA002]